jgi:hypothetical protein
MTILIWRFFKSFFTLFLFFLHFLNILHLFTYFQDLNLSGERVAAKLLASLEEALARSPGRLIHNRALGVAGGGEWVTAKLLASLEEALERVPGRHLERSVLGGDLVLVKGGVGGVDDDCVGRRHDDCYCLLYFISETPLLCLIATI